jgi:hypothetical protein
MAKPLKKPDWLSFDIYNKELSLEEWTVEIYKRVMFDQDTIPGLRIYFDDPTIAPQQASLHLYSPEEQIIAFMQCIQEKNNEYFLKDIKTVAPHPIYPISTPSITDVFIMYKHIITSDWYKNNSKKRLLNKIIEKIHNGESMTDMETLIFMEFQFRAWNNTNSSDGVITYPNEKTLYMNGIPSIINEHFDLAPTSRTPY